MDAPAVRLSGVGVTYPNGATALIGVDLTIRPGERVALVGPSGGGKSTLLNLLSGRVLLDGARVTGAVEVFGADPGALRGRRRRRHAVRVGTIRQDLDLVGPLRVVHNVNAGRLGAWPTWRAVASLVRPGERDEAIRAIEAVGLEAELLDVTADELSGGQRQRVAVARVIRQAPDLLLADEPVASLDPGLGELVLELLVDPRSPWSTSVVSLHQPEFARRFATRVVGVRAGSIAFDVAADLLTDRHLADVYER
ncbi:MAG: ATP-binding cassette domain-containing protein [Ilumatobacter sp.]|nr:ATP-binding cassette domain-containing protein [Ilumatobacter sp.]